MNEKLSASDFSAWLTALKAKIHAIRNKLAYSLNAQILELYWEIGREIAMAQVLCCQISICATRCGTNTLGTQQADNYKKK